MLFTQPKMNGWPPYAYFEKEFSKAECEAIIQIAKTLQPSNAMIGGGTEGTLNNAIRSSELHWLSNVPTPDRQWIFDRINGVCNKVRANFYPFALSGMEEHIQLTRYYASEDGHYDTHMDMGPGVSSTRKLSLVMLLNDPSEFEGGELEMLSIPGEDKKVKELAQGTIIAFPSWELHRVLKVTKGQRWSFVCWIHGPYFT